MQRKSFLALLLLASTGLAETLPKAEALLDRYIELSGGKAAYEKLKSQSMRAEVEFIGQGIKGSSRTLSEYPNRSLTTMELAGVGKMLSGVWDGAVWESSELQGQRLVTGAERGTMLRMSDIRAVANWRSHYSSVSTEAIEDVDGQQCYRVVATPKDGGKPEWSWFSKDSGLVVKTKLTMISPMGELPLEIVVSDYRKAGSFLVPHRSIQSVGPQKIDNRIQEIRFNVAIEPGQLEPPEEIKALIAKQ